MMLTSYLVGFGLLFVVEAFTPSRVDPEEMHHKGESLDRNKRLYVSTDPWPKAILPYEIQDAALPNKPEYLRVIAVYEDMSCVRLPYWNGSSTQKKYGLTHTGRMNLVKASGCWSTGFSVTNRAISVSCCSGHECVHEIGHTLGMAHEHASDWRDGWMRINWNDVWPTNKNVYTKTHRSSWLAQAFPYDISTIMHYKPWMYGVRSGSMSTLFPELQITWEYFYHFAEIAHGYKCAKFPQCNGQDLNCENDGYQTILHGKCTCKCPTGLDSENSCKTPLKKVTTASWPKGQYALPKPKTGCPSGGSFQDGQLKQSGADGNSASNPSHMMGDVKGTQAELNFCTRTISDDVFHTADAAKFNWPTGQYCIYAKGDKCPSVFSKHSFTYDVTSAATTGQLPEGTFGQKTVQMSVCCQYRGFTIDPVDFPTDKPFALIKLGRDCQAVTGMRAESESFTLTSPTNIIFDSGLKKWVGNGGKALTLPLCYYRPADMDCGGSITLSKSNPVATIDGSGIERTDVECTWVIRGSENSTLVFDFEEFNVKKPGRDCVDRVEVRHARIGQYGLNYCGEEPGHSIRSITNKLLVRFFTTGNSYSSFKARIKLTEFDDMCYDVDNRGVGYDGPVNFTRIFEPCLPWAEAIDCYHHPFSNEHLFDSLDGNACRNPDNSFRPWCYTKKQGCKRNYCDVCGLEVPHDRLDYCDKLKAKGFCTANAALALKNCPKTCFDEIPGNQISNKKYSEVTCGQPIPPSDGVLVTKTNPTAMLGETVQYICNRGSSIATSRCMTSGQWSKVASACLECPIGSTLVGKKCFTLQNGGVKTTFVKAVDECKKMNGKIAIPENTKENAVLSMIAEGSNTWININDRHAEGDWVYEDGTKIKFTAWGRSEPNNQGNEDCAVIRSNKQWMDIPCSLSYSLVCETPALDLKCEDALGDKCQAMLTDNPTLCEDEPDLVRQYCRRSCRICPDETAECSIQNADPNVMILTTTTKSTISVGESVKYGCERFSYPTKGVQHQACLPGGKLSGEPLQCGECPLGFKKVNNACHGLVVSPNLSLKEAQDACTKIDGFVAMPKSQAENDAISSLAFGQQIWVGITDGKHEGKFEWQDQSDVSWTNWANGEPKTSGSDEDCAMMNADKSWTNVKCGDSKLATVCSLPKSGHKVCYDRKDKGLTYNGMANVTANLKPCVNWAEMCHNKGPFRKGYERYNLEGNYCRNPDNSNNGPWCYTAGCHWEYCDVCDRSSQPDYDVKDKGRSYVGTAHITVNGEVCAKWADKNCHTTPSRAKYAGLNFDQNYCRNHDGEAGPWCYTSQGCSWALCDMDKANPLNAPNIVDVKCGPPPLPSDGEMANVPRSSYKLGDQVTLKCKRNKFTKTTTCLTNGDWSPFGSLCTECPSGYSLFKNTTTCYGFVDKMIDYDDSIRECAKIGGHLPRPKSKMENEFIKNLNQGQYTWLDVRKVADDNYKDFRWSDGTIPKWASGNEKGAAGLECGFMDQDGIWGTTRCDFLAPKQRLICAVPKLDNPACTDFLGDQCNQLLADKPTMCQDNVEFAEQYCAKSCGVCGNFQCHVAVTDRFTKVSTTNTHISAGQYVQYSCKAGTYHNGGDTQRACTGSGKLTGTAIKCEACPVGYKEHNGFCYGLVKSSNSLTFTQAETQCGNVNGYLASPRTQAENDFIDSIRKGSNIWLGAKTDTSMNVFRWQDMTKVEWTNWGTGEPSNVVGVSEECVIMQSDKTWSDQKCASQAAVVCATPVLGVETCYNPEDKGTTYGGKVSVTTGSKKCIPWATATKCPHNPFTKGDERKNLVENYCRNPDDSSGPWCYIDADTCDKKYCSVCDHEPIPDYTQTKCKPPTPPSDGVLLNDDKFEYNVGDVVGIGCKTANWTVPVTKTCLSNGLWTPLGIACTECPGGYELFQDQCYHYEDQKMSFMDAHTHCEQNVNGYIASPKTPEQNDFVNTISNKGYIWIGLNDMKTEGTWLWEDGTQVTWNNWEPGEPNDWGTEDAGVMKSNKHWNDVYQGNTAAYVCATPKIDPNTLLCEDFLQGQCSMLLAKNQDMCKHHLDFALQFCALSCDICSWKDVSCDVTPGSYGVIAVTKGTTIKAGESVKYSCANGGFYHSKGDEVRTCLNSKELSGLPYECKDVMTADKVTVGPSTLTNGPKVTPDRNAFFGVAEQYRIKEKGLIIAWEYYSSSSIETEFEVWRKTDSSQMFQLVGRTIITTPSGMGEHRHDLPVGQRIEVQPGDLIGIANGGIGGIRFTACDKNIHPEWTAMFYWSQKATSVQDYKVGSNTHFNSNPSCVIFPLRATVAVIG